MTTLAIIGGGIAGRALLFTLAKEALPTRRILFFDGPVFARPCTLSSTAVVAPRGVSTGHSPLGDLLFESYQQFQSFVAEMNPRGVTPIIQYTGATEKLEQFLRRYPRAKESTQLGHFRLPNPVCLAEDPAFLIDPGAMLVWLSEQTPEAFVTRIDDFVTTVEPGRRVVLRCHGGASFEADEVVFATGAYTDFWKELAPEGPVSAARAVQGSYLEFGDTELPGPSSSLTLDGSNLIYRRHTRQVLVGSTTDHVAHELADRRALLLMTEDFNMKLGLALDPERALVRTGLREKAPRREPYLVSNGNLHFLGGYYKNGFPLAIKMARSLAARLRLSPA